MEINDDVRCCAVDEICELQDYDSPKDAMHAFCSNLWPDYGYPTGYGYYGGRKLSTLRDKPSAHYIFTGVIGYKGKRAKAKPTYGPKFAAFIKDFKLGTVSQSEPEYNRVNHPTHLVQVWVWTPDEKALKVWYKKNFKKDPEREERY